MDVMRQAIVSARHRMGEGLGLTRTQLDVFILLASGPKTTGDIAKSLVVTGSAATQTIDTLARQNLVERRPDDDDRRVVRVSLSPEGRRITDQICEQRNRFIRSLASELSDGEVEALTSLANKLYELINTTGSHAETKN